MRTLQKPLTVLLLLAASVIFADESLVLGDFTHEFVAKKNEVVWSVIKENDRIRMVRPADNALFSAVLASEEQRHAFWKKMWWSSNSYQQAECVFFNVDQGVICYLAKDDRKDMVSLAAYNSDYFYFDADIGLMQISKKK